MENRSTVLITIDSAQTFQVLVLAQHLGLEPMEARRQGCPRSQIFSEPFKRKVGSCDSRSASFSASAILDRAPWICSSLAVPISTGCNWRRALGVPATRSSSLHEFAEALRKGFEGEGPSLIEVGV